jgi:hypothetical protein
VTRQPGRAASIAPPQAIGKMFGAQQPKSAKENAGKGETARAPENSVVDRLSSSTRYSAH